MYSRNQRGRRNKKSLTADINIVPFLDVLLVLLVVFISTAPFITKNIKVALPSSNAGVSSINHTQSAILEVFGTKSYTFIINGKAYTGLTVNDVKLLAAHQLSVDKNTSFLLGGQNNIPYTDIISGISLLHSAGIQSVGLMIKPTN